MKILFLILIVLFIPSLCVAHTLKFSSSEMRVKGTEIDWLIKVHLTDYDQKFAQAPVEVVRQFIPGRLGVNLGDFPCALSTFHLDKDVPREVVTMHLTYSCPSTGDLHVSYGVFYGDLAHKHLLKLNRGGEILTSVFSPNETEADFRAPSVLKTLWNFLKLGLKHILEGLDHILFVLSLVLGARRFKVLFWLVTAFTLAHSLSLALAVLGVVRMSPAVVEPAIAASIAFVALRHFFAREDQDYKSDVIITFLFGLIHGLGFSSALLEANLERGHLAIPLLGFNTGVELGQVLIVGLMFPFLQFLEKLMKASYLYFKRAVLLAIAGMGVFWIVQRIWF